MSTSRAIEKTPPGIHKRRVLPALVKNLILLIVLVVVAIWGLSYFVHTSISQRLYVARADMDSYAAALDEAILKKLHNAQTYADVVFQSCYATASGTVDSPSDVTNLLQSLSDLEHDNLDVGVVDPYGNAYSAKGFITDVKNQPFFSEALAGGSCVSYVTVSDGNALVFAVPLQRQSSGGILYLADKNATVVLNAVARLLPTSGAVAILSEDDALIAGRGIDPVSFRYEELDQSGLLYTNSDPISSFRLFYGQRSQLFQIFLDFLDGGLVPNHSSVSAQAPQLSVDAWFEAALPTVGWRCVTRRPLVFNALALQQFFILILAVILLVCIPLLFSLFSGISRTIHNRRIFQALEFDPITGGNNFLYFRQEAEKCLKKSSCNGKIIAFVCLDINRFRVFSQVHGQAAGEALLAKIFRYLEKNLNKHELVARKAADEFSLLLVFAPQEDPLVRVSGLMRGISKLYPDEKIRCTTGVYVVNDRSQPVDRMYGFATVARDAARISASTAPVLFDNRMWDARAKEQQVETLMEKALKNNEFEVYLQPKYRVQDQCLAGAEALVRWISPEQGFVSPGEFIPIFERNGFITKLDDYIMAKVCSIQKNWLSQGRALIPISVNISRAHFADPDVAAHLKSIVDRYAIPYSCIELELTESAFFDDKLALANTVRRLKRYGFTVSMDDFGSGYSSLNSLKDLPLDIVKLDKEFFETATDAERGITLIRDTISMAKNLRMEVVAEGIETIEQVEFLQTTSCDLIQGYFFAKPMPVDEFEKCLPPLLPSGK